MLSFYNFINEILDASYSFNKSKSDETKYLYTFKTDKNLKGSVDIRFLNSGAFYQSPHWYLDFSIDDRQDVTGKGDAFKIFATVKKTVKSFIDEKHPDVIVFTSERIDEFEDTDPNSREKLYYSLIKKLSKEMKFTFEKKQISSWTAFILKREVE